MIGTDENKIYIKYKKKQLIDLLDSGTVTEPLSQYALVDGYVLDILKYVDGEDKTEIINYLTEQDRLKDEIKKVNNQIVNLQDEARKLLEEYTQNGRDIYEEIKKL